VRGLRIPAAPDAPPPVDLIVSLHPAVRALAGGRVVAGGSPFRLVQLTDDGARVVAGWKRPSPIGAAPGHRRLARRLLDAGILSPHPPPTPSTSDLTVVVPVRDRSVELGRCLEAVGAACPESPVVVVDDGSTDPAAVEAPCAGHGARLLRLASSHGPAAARNRGLAACSTSYVAFVDSDVVLPASSPGRLLGHLSDPCVAAVAPRVRALPPGRGLIGGYEQRHSPLDMGPTGGLVAPGLPISYVPSTVLFVRRSAMGDGFDESLVVGEDVDLVWRLSAAGWRVRYAPKAEVWHDHRVHVGSFVARRHLYARSIGMLARRHPRALPAMWVSPMLVLPWGLLAAGRRRAALAAAIATTLRTGRQLRRLRGQPYRLAGALVARGHLATGLALAHAVRRSWAPPLLVVAIRRPDARRVLVAAFATSVVQDALSTREPRAVIADVPIRLLDEVIAAAGTWDGCVRERTIRPLLPSWRLPDQGATS